MIYTDGTHLITDADLGELHQFAAKLGLKREWFQDSNPRHPHYDLTTQRIRKRALALGAQLVSVRDVVRILAQRGGE